MEDHNGLSLESVEILEQNGKYTFAHIPMLHGSAEFILSKDESGKEVIGTENVNSPLEIDKDKLEELAYAYVFIKDGEKYGTPVRILTRSPKVRQLILQPEGKVQMVLVKLDSFVAQAGLNIRIMQGEKNRGGIILKNGDIEFALAQAGIALNEKIKIEMQISYYRVDDNHTSVLGPRSNIEFVINPPAIEQLIRNETEIALKLSEEPALPLYARIYKDGQSIFSAISCKKKAEKEYVISTDTFNLTEGSYSLSVICMNEITASYLSEPLPLITDRPLIQNIRREGEENIIRMKEIGYYCWQEQYGWTDEIKIGSGEEPEIRYADRYNDVVSLGPLARITESAQNGFKLKDGYYYLSDRNNDCALKEKYVSYSNNTFLMEEKDGSWILNIKDGYEETVRQDFKDLLLKECSTYAQLEELTAYFGDMFLKTEDMLSIRYGYDPQCGVCDIRAGMMLCFDYSEYQNIPEQDRESLEEEVLSDRNLSGFVGNGHSIFRSILRDGKITFEPFAQETVKNGMMVVEPPQIANDGRISMGAGIWDTLFEQFGAAFIKLLYPSVWKQSGHLNHGSMYYFDNVCLVAADSYENLEKAAESYRKEEKPFEGATYVCFRGRTIIKPMINIFVEGNPQLCALGTTLGDIIAAYGLSRNVLIKRLYGDRYVPFINTDTEIPLYIGDQICSR